MKSSVSVFERNGNEVLQEETSLMKLLNWSQDSGVFVCCPL